MQTDDVDDQIVRILTVCHSASMVETTISVLCSPNNTRIYAVIHVRMHVNKLLCSSKTTYISTFCHKRFKRQFCLFRFAVLYFFVYFIVLKVHIKDMPVSLFS